MSRTDLNGYSQSVHAMQLAPLFRGLGIDRRTNADILLPISASASVPDDAFLRQRRRVNTPPTQRRMRHIPVRVGHTVILRSKMETLGAKQQVINEMKEL